MSSKRSNFGSMSTRSSFTDFYTSNFTAEHTRTKQPAILFSISSRCSRNERSWASIVFRQLTFFRKNCLNSYQDRSRKKLVISFFLTTTLFWILTHSCAQSKFFMIICLIQIRNGLQIVFSFFIFILLGSITAFGFIRDVFAPGFCT